MFAVTLAVPVSLSQREIACEHQEPNRTGNHPYFRAHLFSPFRRRGCCSQTSERTGQHKWLIDKMCPVSIWPSVQVSPPRASVFTKKLWPSLRKVVIVTSQRPRTHPTMEEQEWGTCVRHQASTLSPSRASHLSG